MPEPRVIDGRDMVPPEPLERAWAELPRLARGEELIMLLRREPLPLYAVRDRNGYRFRSEQRSDGTNETRIQKDQA